MAVIRKAVAQWLAVHKINGRGFEKFGHEICQCCGIGAVTVSIPLERYGGSGNTTSGYNVGTMTPTGSDKASDKIHYTLSVAGLAANQAFCGGTITYQYIEQ